VGVEKHEHDGIASGDGTRKSTDDASVLRKALSLTFLKDLPLYLATLGGFLYATLSIFRHVRFGSTAYDLGIFDQTIWGYSNFEIVNNTVRGLPNLLGDHFHPILMTLAPLYWVWDDVRMILIAQAALVAISSVPVAWWAREKLGSLPSVFVQLAYLSFWGLLAGILFDFHEVAFAVPIIAFGLYAMLAERNRLLWAMIVLGFLTKEDMAPIFAAMGLYVAVVQERWRLGLAVASTSATWFMVTIEIIMPAIAGTAYGYWGYTALGSSPGSALAYVVRHPLESMTLLFEPAQPKVPTYVRLFGVWLLLPLFSPLLLVALPVIAARFWSTTENLWATGYHYSLTIAPILAFAAIDALSRLQPRFARLPGTRSGFILTTVLAIAMLLAGLRVSYGEHLKPFAEVNVETGGYWVSAERAAEVQSCLDVIPAHASVSASSALIPHLTHRQEIYRLETRPEQEYMAVDFSTSSFPSGLEGNAAIVAKTLEAGYGVACSRGQTVVLHRDGTGRDLSPEIARILEPYMRSSLRR
jgi:uncharacterized membrane protein